MTEELEVPAYRERILRELEDIASQTWVPQVLANPGFTGYGVNIEEIDELVLGGLDLTRRRDKTIGVAFYDKAEMLAVLAFAQVLEAMNDDTPDDTDYALVTHPRWPELVDRELPDFHRDTRHRRDP